MWLKWDLQCSSLAQKRKHYQISMLITLTNNEYAWKTYCGEPLKNIAQCNKHRVISLSDFFQMDGYSAEEGLSAHTELTSFRQEINIGPN